MAQPADNDLIFVGGVVVDAIQCIKEPIRGSFIPRPWRGGELECIWVSLSRRTLISSTIFLVPIVSPVWGPAQR